MKELRSSAAIAFIALSVTGAMSYGCSKSHIGFDPSARDAGPDDRDDSGHGASGVGDTDSRSAGVGGQSGGTAGSRLPSPAGGVPDPPSMSFAGSASVPVAGRFSDRAYCPGAVEEATNGMVDRACADCVCLRAPIEASECSAHCFELAYCVYYRCPPSANGMNDVSCILAMCSDVLDAAAETMAVPFSECESECFTPNDNLDDASTLQ